ncbi:hypothetical protein BCR44DRAFT_1430592 [Catenaria anguillulae PL171]|uniref:Uncharacterized protein n=1 Tax=Catenaria anguillulae PL171 TaxID=765915 RepID=A0A1Y2HV50_9FUNG|nr:hypothetical protein BCR44DRAFT_1430592 [Catenaria anguillulae PL171]
MSGLVMAYPPNLNDEELIHQFLKDVTPFSRIKLIHAHLTVSPEPHKNVAHYLNKYVGRMDATRPTSRGPLSRHSSCMLHR